MVSLVVFLEIVLKVMFEGKERKIVLKIFLGI